MVNIPPRDEQEDSAVYIIRVARTLGVFRQGEVYYRLAKRSYEAACSLRGVTPAPVDFDYAASVEELADMLSKALDDKGAASW